MAELTVISQDLKSDEVDELARVARTRWAEYALPKAFRVENVFFVQNTRRKQWLHEIHPEAAA